MPYKAALLSLCCFSACAGAQSGWELSLGTGGALNLPESISIKMDNGDQIDSDSVSLRTQSFKTPPYYTLRSAYWQDDAAWELEFIHHKVYADSADLNSRVQHFEITDGYNLLYLNYAAAIHADWNVRMGLGAVIPHPDVTVDNRRSHGGYQLGGVSTQFGLEREFVLRPNLIFSLEGKVTYSYAEFDLDFGKARLANTALHLVGQLKFGL